MSDVRHVVYTILLKITLEGQIGLEEVESQWGRCWTLSWIE